MPGVEFTYLSQEDVIEAGGLDMKKAMDSIEKAFRLLNEGKVVIPSKIVMVLPPGEEASWQNQWVSGAPRWGVGSCRNKVDLGIP